VRARHPLGAARRRLGHHRGEGLLGEGYRKKMAMPIRTKIAGANPAAKRMALMADSLWAATPPT
jgi:hypothetical protein